MIKKRYIPAIILLVSAIVFTAFAPRFLFRKIRIQRELDRILQHDMLYLNDLTVADYRGRWNRIFAKLELSKNQYERLKPVFLHLEYESFAPRGFTGDVEEHSVTSALYPVRSGLGWTTGETFYTLVKERSGSYYIYIEC